MKIVENLAFKGGGVLGAAYVGALVALEEWKLAGWGSDPNGKVIVYGNVKRVAGTSAGAICAALVALGRNATEIAKIMDEMTFSSFVDVDPNFPANSGLCLGKVFLDWMEGKVKDALKKDNATFTDLAALAQNDPRYKDLHIFSHQVKAGRTFEFSAQSTPDVPIAQAVRASMSIPIFFVPWSFSGDLAKAYPGDFVDGGVAFNYPISAFDSGDPNRLTLGILLNHLSYTTQGSLETSIHSLLAKKGASEDTKAVVESLIELIKLGPYDAAAAKAHLQSRMSAAPQGAADDIALVLEIILAFELAWDILQQGGRIEQAIAAIVKAFEDFIKNDQDLKPLFAFLTALGRWGSVIGAMQNTPTNVVFERDAARSIVVNTLGYAFTDFYMPECNKKKLVASGYNSATKYLSLIMYS